MDRWMDESTTSCGLAWLTFESFSRERDDSIVFSARYYLIAAYSNRCWNNGMKDVKTRWERVWADMNVLTASKHLVVLQS